MPVEVDGNNFIISKNQRDKFILLSAICPHQGGIVKVGKQHIECPIHHWKFNLEGKSINVQGQSLSLFPLTVVDGWLCVNEDADAHLPSKKHPAAQKSRTPDVLFKLHSHACMEIIYDDFHILTDPWLSGTAFLGSWINYPKTVVDAKSLKPGVIIITHEHSDHLHEATLQLFDKSTPIYFPDFPNKRIGKILKSIGFKNRIAMKFGEKYQLANKIKISCYEPRSLWNDAIFLLEINTIKILNINDAGINYSISNIVGKIDVLMMGFSTTASGYPATWTHISDNKKREHYRKAVSGTHKLLKQAMKLYGAQYLVPFAAFATLQHPAHQHYVQLTESTNVDAIKKYFKNTTYEVINLLPGESWNMATGSFTNCYTKKERLSLFDKKNKIAYANNYFNKNEFNREYLGDYTITKKELVAYFEKLNLVPEIIFCEDLIFRVNVLHQFNGTVKYIVDCCIKSGNLTVVDIMENPHEVNIELWIPQQIIGKIVKDDLSWDEAHIGYWCRFTRNPDIYHEHFWRLLQAPYFEKEGLLQFIEKTNHINKTSNIAKVINNDPQSERIFRRYGLYCSICGNGISENIEQGARKHGLSDNQIDKLVKEINFVA